MSGRQDTGDSDQLKIALAVYQALRAEILTHTQLQAQLAGFAATAIGAFSGIALANKTPELLLILPVVTLILGLAHLEQSRSTWALSRYILDTVAAAAPGLGDWEQSPRRRTGPKVALGGVIPYATLFAVGPLAAAVYVWSYEDIDDALWPLALLVAVAALAYFGYALSALSAARDHLRRTAPRAAGSPPPRSPDPPH